MKFARLSLVCVAAAFSPAQQGRAQTAASPDAALATRLEQSYMPPRAQELYLRNQAQALQDVASTPNIGTLNPATQVPLEGAKDIARDVVSELALKAVGLGNAPEQLAAELNRLNVQMPIGIMNQNNASGASLAEQSANIDAWMKKSDLQTKQQKRDELSQFNDPNDKLCATGALICHQAGDNIACSPNVPDPTYPNGNRSLGVVILQCIGKGKIKSPRIISQTDLDHYTGPGRISDTYMNGKTFSRFAGINHKSYCQPCSGELVDCKLFFWSPACR